MTEELFARSTLDDAIQALKQDLLAPGGPRISTMRNYRFAIVPYRPADEFKLRRLVRRLTDDLTAENWSILSISLQKLFLDRVRALGADEVERIVAREKRLYEKDPERALEHVREKIAPLIEGTDGIAADVARLIERFAADAPGDEDRTLVLLAEAYRRQDAELPRRPALPRRAAGHDHPLLHGRGPVGSGLPPPHLPVAKRTG